MIGRLESMVQQSMFAGMGRSILLLVSLFSKLDKGTLLADMASTFLVSISAYMH